MEPPSRAAPFFSGEVRKYSQRRRQYASGILESHACATPEDLIRLRLRRIHLPLKGKAVTVPAGDLPLEGRHGNGGRPHPSRFACHLPLKGKAVVGNAGCLPLYRKAWGRGTTSSVCACGASTFPFRGRWPRRRQIPWICRSAPWARLPTLAIEDCPTRHRRGRMRFYKRNATVSRRMRFYKRNATLA